MRRDGPSRRTAATIVAATGALLLLAAAVTFLAVSWDQLGLTARVAAVGTGTAAAIVGGARLRHRLPAVGAVVFHLGALLLPVDALGLALQLDASVATTWVVVGITTLVTLPVAAWFGGSRTLAAVALTGVPVLATGIGLAGGPPAPLVTAIVAAVAVVLARTSTATSNASADPDGRADTGPAALVPWVAPALAAIAIVGPLVVAIAAELALAASGTPLLSASEAGWVPATWAAAAASGATAVVALVGTAALRRSALVGGAVPIAVALVGVSLLLPGDAPRLAQLLPWPLVFLATEGAALAVRRDRVLAAPAVTAALVTELLAALTLPILLVVAGGAIPTDAAGVVISDATLAAVVLLAGLAWALAAVRRSPADPTTVDGEELAVRTGRRVRGALDAPAATAAGVAAAISLAAGIAFLWPLSGLGAAVLLATVAVATLAPTTGPVALLASGVVLLLGALGLTGTWSVAIENELSTPTIAVLVAVVAAGLVVATVVRTDRHAAEATRGPAILLLPAAVGYVAVAGVALDDVGTGLAVLVAGALLAGSSWLLPNLARGAVGLRVLGGVVVLTLPSGALSLDGAVTAATGAALVGSLLVVAVVRGERRELLALAGPVLARALAGGTYAVTGSEAWTGGALLTVAILAAAATVLRPDVRLAGAVTAFATGLPAIALLSLTPTALAWGTTGAGVAIVVVGLLVRRAALAHVGGVVANLGVWQLLALADVTSADVWLAGPALQVWLLAVPARRAGRLTSWTADVPPLLLVVVPALFERVSGGSGWHTAAAGALAVAAVALGGAGRHAGPLVIGVGTVVVVVGIETLAVVAAVPTWAWLTVGGLVLLGAAALIERTGGAPIEGARRLVDVLAERFD